MAQTENIVAKVEIFGLDAFKGLVKALGPWLREASEKTDRTPAEAALLSAARAIGSPGIYVKAAEAADTAGRETETEQDAARYRWLRARDLETIGTGGVFAGLTPQNVVLNGVDLDQRIDFELSQAQQTGKAKS